MTDYQLVDAFLAHAEVMITYFMGFISATSALLVVAYAAGTKMPLALARVAVAIYALTAVFLIAAFHRISAVIIAIRGQMGPTLDWHPVLAEPRWVLSLLTALGLTAMIIVAVGAVWYFQHARRGISRGDGIESMILEVAILDVIPRRETAFEQAFVSAQTIIAAQAGYLGHELQRCVETPNRYVLLVRWETLEAHTQGFRASADYAKWKDLLHHFYDPLPTVEHYAATLP